ncbi:hypothetical protein [Methylotenera sp.]|uniref:hypothetical protein n=1 Tax=Methylotenera sp. TaxID=2051956 RepID=UPI002732A944|nr:hypothetical protein [Methylotenera sp.]MDP3308291.1 hypothetical protein [Methylotenera sp.]
MPEPKNFSKAKTWILDDDDHIASFVWVCGLFELDPKRARRQIVQRWQDNTKAARRHGTKVPTHA